MLELSPIAVSLVCLSVGYIFSGTTGQNSSKLGSCLGMFTCVFVILKTKCCFVYFCKNFSVNKQDLRIDSNLPYIGAFLQGARGIRWGYVWCQFTFSNPYQGLCLCALSYCIILPGKCRSNLNPIMPLVSFNRTGLTNTARLVSMSLDANIFFSVIYAKDYQNRLLG